MRQHPSFRRRHLFAGRNQLIDHAGCDRGLTREARAFQQDRKCLFDSGQARQPLGSPASRQQPDQRLRQAKRDPGIVDHDPMMGRQCQFTAAAKREARDRGRDRLARRFDSTQCLTETKEMVECHAVARPGRRSHDHVIGQSQFGKIGTGTECRRLSRTDDDTLDVAFAEPPAEDAEFGDRGVGEHIHRTAGHVENKM